MHYCSQICQYCILPLNIAIPQMIAAFRYSHCVAMQTILPYKCTVMSGMLSLIIDCFPESMVILDVEVINCLFIIYIC